VSTKRSCSPASAEASRRNGARSKGPRTAVGKFKSSQNSRKHGLFSAEFALAGKLPAAMADLEDALPSSGHGWIDGADQAELMRVATLQLEAASRLVGGLREELNCLLAAENWDPARAVHLLQQLARLSRYQRRFRGKRDRALRRLTAVAVSAAPQL
jgi:hypothetical protein